MTLMSKLFANGLQLFNSSDLFFSGNSRGDLFDHSSVFVSDFGDYIEDGDRIGFILDAGEKELKVYIVQNDRPLGLAYIKKAPYAYKLYPAVLFHGSSAIVEINEKKNVSTDHLLVRGDYPEKGERSTVLAIQKVSD